jgi:hypothetical protein
MYLVPSLENFAASDWPATHKFGHSPIKVMSEIRRLPLLRGSLTERFVLRRERRRTPSIVRLTPFSYLVGLLDVYPAFILIAQFVWGIDLKQALKTVNTHFLDLPEEECNKGITRFAHSPPDGNLMADLWDRHLGKGYRKAKPVKTNPEKVRRFWLALRVSATSRRSTRPRNRTITR